MSTRAALVAGVMVLLAAPAAAQTPGQPRVYVAADGLYQALFDPFTKSSAFELFYETGRFTAVYPAGTSPAFAGTVALRLWKSISVGGTVTRVRTLTDATVEGEIPHPFFFDRNREVSGTVEDVEREEQGVHVQFRLIIPVTRRFDLSIFGGPSRWQVRQQRITTLDYTSTYPFDTATLTGVGRQEVDATTWGYNAGLDASLYFTRNVGVGALLLVATANPSEDPTATTADTRIGGLRAGGGVRLRF